MPKLNRVLIRSIVSEVEELISLSREISSTIEEMVDASVKPITTGTTIMGEMLKNYQGTAGEIYILLLELTYDRINIVMGLMIEFIEHRNRLETHEEPPRSLVRGEDQATVVTRAKLLWKRLEARPEVRKINSRDIERGMALFDEYKIAIGHRLAVMTESNIALEKTVVEIRKEIIDRPLAKENVAESVHPIRTTNESDELSMGTWDSARYASQPLPITPDDDPVTDMTREILSNEKKNRLSSTSERASLEGSRSHISVQ